MARRPSRPRPAPTSAPDPHGPGGGATPRVVVVGMGNVLTGDDALGPTVVRHLQAGFAPRAEVELVDAGTPGMDLAGLLADADAAIVVDTVLGDELPGTVKRWDREALLARALQPRTNPHAPGLHETLLSLELLGLGPGRVVLVGVVPRAVEVGHGLTPEVEAAVPAAVEAITQVLAGWGTPLTPLPDPPPPDLWWKRSPVLSGSR